MWFLETLASSFLGRKSAQETQQLIIPHQATQTTEVPADSGTRYGASKINEILWQDNSFVTISANGMQPQTWSPSISQIESGPSTSPSPRTHDTSRSRYHVDHIDRFAEALDQAASRAFPNKNRVQNRYLDAHVVLIRWEDDARLGVSCELDDLSKTFEKDYGFETTTWLIPTENSLTDITSKALELLKEAGRENKLLILYYGGHAKMNSARQQIWLRTGRENEGTLEWFALQQYFLNAKADVLFLLDCCSAASAATSSQTAVGMKETLGACGFESETPEPGPHSFTSELIDVLGKWKHRAPFSVAMLHSELLANLRHPKPQEDMFHNIVELRRTPAYFVTTSNPRALSIELARRQEEVVCRPDRPSQKRRSASTYSDTPVALVDDNRLFPEASGTVFSNSIDGVVSGTSTIDKYAEDQLNRVLPGGDLAIPHVLVSLSLEGEQYLDLEQWDKWLRDCPAFAKHVRVEGKFKSNSTLLLLSIPVVIWDLLPGHLACSFISYVKSINHVRDGSWQDNEELQLWLKRERGVDSDPGDEKQNASIRSLDENNEDSRSYRRLEDRSGALLENQSHPPNLPQESASHETILVSGPSSFRDDVARVLEAKTISEHTGESPSIMSLPGSPSIHSNVQSAELLEQYDPTCPVEEQLSPSWTNSVGSSSSDDGHSNRSQIGAGYQTPLSDIEQVSQTNQLLQEIWNENEKRTELEESEDFSGGSRKDSSMRVSVPEGYSSHSYQYNPLASSDEIRLVVLPPGPVSEPVHLSIMRVTLKDAPEYQALSYSWGNATPTRPVLVDNDGCTLRVTTNLFAALQNLGQQSSPRTLWIDTLCINQSDSKEKNAQVAMMGKIYAQAMSVIIWLGPETEDSRSAIENLNQNRLAILDGLDRHPNHKIKQMFSDTWTTVEAGLLSRSYWRRVWIVQEISLAKTITVVCGPSAVDWNLLVAAMKMKETEMLQFEVTRLAMNRPLVNFLEIEKTRLQKYSVYNSIESLMMRWRNSRATDPRDKIYGLLGLATDIEDGDIVPDYSKTVEQVFRDVTRFIITKQQQLDIISERSGQSHSCYRSLPSWVPDWTVDRLEPLDRLDIQADNESSKIAYRASKGASMSATFSDDHTTLFVKGFVLDKTKTVGPALFSGGEFSDIITAARKMTRSSSDLFIIGSEDRRMDVSRTISLDLFRRLFDEKDRHTLWDMFKSTYKPPITYRPGAPHNHRLEMFRIDVLYTMLRLNLGRRFAMTAKGYMGLVPADAQIGDAICILFGGSVPFVLRREQDHYKLIGSCYVHGVMDGEAMDDFQAGPSKIETFTIL